MKKGITHKTSFSSRVSPAPKKKGFFRSHPLISTIAVGVPLIALLRVCGEPPKPQNTDIGKGKPDAGLVSKNEDAGSRARKGIRELRTLIKMRKKFRDAGTRTSHEEEDFDSWKEGLAYKSISELRNIWHQYNEIMVEGTAKTYPGGRVDWKEAGSRAQEAKRRRDAAGIEIGRKKAAREQI